MVISRLRWQQSSVFITTACSVVAAACDPDDFLQLLATDAMNCVNETLRPSAPISDAIRWVIANRYDMDMIRFYVGFCLYVCIVYFASDKVFIQEFYYYYYYYYCLYITAYTSQLHVITNIHSGLLNLCYVTVTPSEQCTLLSGQCGAEFF